MTRVVQPKGTRGSLKWIQLAVNNQPSVLDEAIGIGGKITWLSPKVEDDYAEYRDTEFLRLIGCENLSLDLEKFWPRRGPQWDALARTDHGEVLIVEAKAHIPEMFSPPSAAGPESRVKIDAALQKTAAHLGAKSTNSWGVHFYQLTNRLAHLIFLREHKIDARLVFVSFLGDEEMKGPKSKERWEDAYAEAENVLGLQHSHELRDHITHAYVDVRKLA